MSNDQSTLLFKLQKLLRRSFTVELCYRTGRSFIFIHIFYYQKKSFSSNFIFASRILMIFSSGGVDFIYIWLFFSYRE